MYANLIIVALLAIAYIVEGFHDWELRKLWKTKEQTGSVKRWHRLDALFHVIIITGYALIMSGSEPIQFLFVAIQLASLRQLLLNTTQNLLAKQAIWYLGSTSTIDILLKPYEKIVFFGNIIIVLVLTMLINKCPYIFY
jgi:type IV secretory pathway TraG/TraD family ATPase VirD4